MVTLAELQANLSWKRRITAASIALGWSLLSHVGEAQSVTAAWSPSQDSAVVGYMVYYGTASGAYSSRLDAGTNTTLSISGLNAGTTYYFAATAYDTQGVESIFSNEASYSVPSDTAPAITVPPVNQSVIAGETATFTVTATGTGPLSYQWFKGATELAGATSATLTLINLVDANAGSYSVMITNVAGSVSSSAATLTVLDAPVITRQPVSLTNMAGTTATFIVAASGTAPLGYQWFKGATALAGATSATLTLINQRSRFSQ